MNSKQRHLYGYEQKKKKWKCEKEKEPFFRSKQTLSLFSKLQSTRRKVPLATNIYYALVSAIYDSNLNK